MLALGAAALVLLVFAASFVWNRAGARRVDLNPGPGRAEFAWGRGRRRECVAVSKERLTVVLRPGVRRSRRKRGSADEDPWGLDVQSAVEELWLISQSGGESLLLAGSSRPGGLRDTFETLARESGLEARDETLAEVPVGAATRTLVDREPVGEDLRGGTVRFRSPDVVRCRLPVSMGTMRRQRLQVLAVGVILFLPGLLLLAVGSPLPWVALGLLTAAGLLADQPGALGRRLVLDRTAGLLRIADGFRRWYDRDLGDVVAVQLCSRNTGRLDHEVNLVLRGPPGYRLTVKSGAERKRCYGDALRLAEFLKVPFLDHAAPAETPACAETEGVKQP
jgi:hypothetical protein